MSEAVPQKKAGRVVATEATSAGEMATAMRVLPEADLNTLLRAGPPVILAPHPDDETLGCGGLIAACNAAGRPPMVVILTDGTGSHRNSRTHPPARLRNLREEETRNAVAVLGLNPGRLRFLRLKDTAAPSAGAEFDATVARIANLLHSCGAGTLIAPWLGDPHCDHVAAQLMARAAACETGVRLLSYPVWGWTLPPDTPIVTQTSVGWRLPITEQLEAKRQAIAAHRSQLGEVVFDDPTGFTLPRTLLSVFEQPYETFLLTSDTPNGTPASTSSDI